MRSTTISRNLPPDRGTKPVIQKIRIRYTKRGRLRFVSHRDFARALERALRRAAVPMAYSAGFSPHPKISYASAAPTGAASEAEYLEIGLQERAEPSAVVTALDAALPPGIDVLDAVEATGGSLAERIDASAWRVELAGVDPAALDAAVSAFLGATEVLVERLTKQGMRTFDARAAVVRAETSSGAAGGGAGGAQPQATEPPGREHPASCAILDLVVRHVTPSVRPDDVLTGLRVVANLEPPVPARVTRLAQGALTERGEIIDPLAADREARDAIRPDRTGTLTGALPSDATDRAQPAR